MTSSGCVTLAAGKAPLPGSSDTRGSDNPACGLIGDIDGDGTTSGGDLAILLGAWTGG